MTTDTNGAPLRRGRWSGVAAGAGLTAGAALSAALLSLTAAPAAHADDPCLGPFCIDTGTTTETVNYLGVIPSTETINFDDVSAGPFGNDFDVSSLAGYLPGVASISGSRVEDDLFLGPLTNYVYAYSNEIASATESQTISVAEENLGLGPVHGDVALEFIQTPGVYTEIEPYIFFDVGQEREFTGLDVTLTGSTLEIQPIEEFTGPFVYTFDPIFTIPF